MNTLHDTLQKHEFVLTEAAVLERLRRSHEVELHELLLNAPLIYDDPGQEELASIYREYIEIAQESSLPFLMFTPTWRANKARLFKVPGFESINADAVRFMQLLRNECAQEGAPILIGGLMGCRNDCYKPQESLDVDEARAFHAWQAIELAKAGVDCLMASAIPSVDEALGMALAMECTEVPFIIGFVINRNGCVLDGTRLDEAVARIDRETAHGPLGYAVNCAYPTFLRVADQSPALYERLILYQGNGSSLDHDQLDGADEVITEPVSDWSEAMMTLNRQCGVKILGGCCGTDGEHLRQLVHDLALSPVN